MSDTLPGMEGTGMDPHFVRDDGSVLIDDTLADELDTMAATDPAAYTEMLRVAEAESEGDLEAKRLVMRGAAAAIRFLRGRTDPDRKSTRLNSSH